MAESQQPAKRAARLLALTIPVAAAGLHALLGWAHPGLTPLGRLVRLSPGGAAAAAAATVLALWLLLALRTAREAGWRQGLAIAAPVQIPFLLLLAQWVPGFAEAGPRRLALLADIVWALWALNAVAVLVWAGRGRLPGADATRPPDPLQRWDRLRGWLDVVLPFALGAAALRIYWPDLHLGLGTLDQRALAYAAKRTAEGLVLYRDVFAPLAPGPVYLVAALFKAAEPGLLVAKAPQVAGAALVAVAAYAAARRYTTPLFATAAALLIAAVAPSLALALALFAVTCAFQATWSREAAWSAAGVLTGFAVLFDPTIGAAAAGALLLMIALRQVRGVRARMTARGVDMGLGWATGARYLLIALLPAAAATGYFAWAQALPDLWQGAVVTRLGPVRLPGLGRAVLEQVSASGLMAPASLELWAAPAALVLGLLRLAHGFSRRRWGEVDLLLVSLVLWGALLVCVGGPAAAPALLVAAHVVSWGWEGVARVLGGESRRAALLRLDAYAAGAAAVAALAMGISAAPLAHLAEVNRLDRTAAAYRALPQVRRAAGVLLDDKEASALEEVLEIIAHRAPVSKHILCFPDCPEIYFLSDRDTPTRFIVGGMFVDEEAMMKGLAGTPPAVVILREGALSRGLMGKAIPELLGRAGYRLDRTLDSYVVYLPRK